MDIKWWQTITILVMVNQRREAQKLNSSLILWTLLLCSLYSVSQSVKTRGNPCSYSSYQKMGKSTNLLLKFTKQLMTISTMSGWHHPGRSCIFLVGQSRRMNIVRPDFNHCFHSWELDQVYLDTLSLQGVIWTVSISFSSVFLILRIYQFVSHYNQPTNLIRT